MIKKPVTLQSDLDMESRPIAHLVQEASQYDSTVYIEMDNMKINAKSIMGMMALQSHQPGKGTNLTLIAEGACGAGCKWSGIISACTVINNIHR